MPNPLQQLSGQGVVVWVDSIARDWLEKGKLRRLRDQSSVVGVTSNPTIFQATRLFDLLAVANVMIKIPATVEGLPAIRASIAAGVNVNVTPGSTP